MADVTGLNIDPVSDTIQSIQPQGATNIRDALRSAYEEINPYPSRSATQVVLLMTDGLHNTPAGTSPEEVVPDFQGAGIQIFTLGVGTSGEVDMDTLDDLSWETGGISYQVGDNQPDLMREAMAQIDHIVHGGVITSQLQTFNAARQNAMTSWSSPISRIHKRPSLQDVIDTLGARSIEDLTQQRFQKPGQVFTLPAEVERGSLRASFTILFGRRNPLWLYLVDPKGRVVDSGSPGARMVTGRAPHEFMMVEKPIPGRWLMVIVRPGTGPRLRFRALVGSENRHLQVFGGAPTHVEPGTRTRLWASARWGANLSGLVVKAFITDARGRKSEVVLSDDQPDEPHSGSYECFLVPRLPGKYSGYIHIKNDGAAIHAQGLTLLRHSRSDSVSLQVNVPPFERIIPFNIRVGKKVVLVDRDNP
jgi:hypothetical protein